jgi:membrane protein
MSSAGAPRGGPVRALYGSSGAKTLLNALNIAYEEREQRGLLELDLLALGFTLAAILAVAMCLGVIVFLPMAVSYLPLGPLGAIAVRSSSCSCSALP